ncbi:MAG: hypothetical protein E7465_09710 [Ruminococcaceae bacterium]|nr:hypothetical protein [Oscillospiraceae bacterium]
MDQRDYEIPTNKRKSTTFFIIMIILSVGLLIVSTLSFYDDSVPEKLIQVSCTFRNYEIQNHTRSISYDLLLISEDYDMPFELSFFDGYKKQLSPEDFCTGNTYSLWVSSSKSCYMIYSCSDAEGNLIMTKQEAYLNSQRTAHIVLTVFLLASISLWVVLLLIIHRPDLFGDRVKRFFFAKRKSI